MERYQLAQLAIELAATRLLLRRVATRPVELLRALGITVPTAASVRRRGKRRARRPRASR